jgi:hypothetical protein
MGEKTVQMAVRIPESWLARADRLAKRLTMTPDIPVNRTAVIRAAMSRGLDAMEAEYTAASPERPTEAAAPEPKRGDATPARKPKPSK